MAECLGFLGDAQKGLGDFGATLESYRKALGLYEAALPEADDAVIDDTISALVRQWEGDEAPEGVAAFFERRAPKWAQPG